MKYIFLFICLLASLSPYVQAQALYVGSTASLYVSGSAQIDGNVSSAPTLYVNGATQNNGTITNAGEMQHTGSFTSVAGTFSSTGDNVFLIGFTQNLAGNFTGSGSFYNLILNKTSNALVLSTDAEVSNQVNLVTGKIFMGSLNLTLAPAATIVGYDANDYIVSNLAGTLRQTVGAGSKVFPIGTTTSYNPITLSNSGAADVFSARVSTTVGCGGTLGTDAKVNRMWHISEAVAGGSNLNITAQWATADEGSAFLRTASGLSTYDGTNFKLPATNSGAASISAGVWSQSLTGITNPSPFTVTSIGQISGGSLTYCEGVANVLTAPSDPSVTAYQWMKNMANIPSFSTGSTYAATTGGNYTVAMLSGGCNMIPAEVSVTALPAPAAPALVSPAVSPTVICNGTSTTLEVANLPNHTIEWRWFTGAPNVSPIATSSANPLSTPIQPTSKTYYAFQQDNITGCWSQLGTEARVNLYALPTSNASAGPDRLVCPGNNALIGPTSVTGWTYVWTPATLLSSATASRPTVSNVPVDYNQNYVLTVTSSQGCTSKDTVNVSAHNVTALNAVRNAGADAAVCSGLPLPIGTAATPGYAYTWSPSASLDNRFAANPVHLFNNTSSTAASTTNYTRTVADNLTGCTVRDTVVVTTNPLPGPIRVNAGADQTIVQGGQTVIGGVNAVAGLTYSWSPATGLNNPALAKPTANPTTTTTYTITVTNSFACSRADNMLLTVNPVRMGVFTDKVEIVAYPNPVKDILSLRTTAAMTGAISLSLVNTLGQTVMEREITLLDTLLETEFDLSRLAPGAYSILLHTGEGEEVIKFVKE